METTEVEKLKDESEYWEPQPRQLLFLQSYAYEALYGGAKGGGKTDALLAESTRQIHIPRYRGAIFRREITRLGEIIDRSHRWFSRMAKWNEQKKTWTFPSGAKIYFFHCQYEQDKNNHQGKEYQFIGFDQIEEFTESMYDFIKGANRSSDPSLRCYVRCTANPGNIGHAWVKNKFISKLDRNGEVKYFKIINEEDTEVPQGTPGSQSRAYIFARVYDNPALLKSNPEYLSVLQNLPRALRLAFLEGDWDAFEGQYFAEWKRILHVITYTEFKHSIFQLPITRFASIDYGYAKPAAIHFHAILPEGKLRTYKEIYGAGMDYVSLAEKFKETIEPGEVFDYIVCDPAIQGDKSHHKKEPMKDGDMKGESGFDILKKELQDVCPVLLGDNRRVVGWTRMHEYLKPFINQHGEEDSFWKITSNCVNLIRTLPTLIHSTSKPEDVNTDCEDHAPDDCRYGIMSRPETPVEIKTKWDPGEKFWRRVKLDIKRKKENNPLQVMEQYGINEEILLEEGEHFIPDG